MYQSRDIVSQGTIDLGTRGPRTFVQGHIVSGRPFTPPFHPSRRMSIVIKQIQWEKAYSTFICALPRQQEEGLASAIP
jgi:hypothetical protein